MLNFGDLKYLGFISRVLGRKCQHIAREALGAIVILLKVMASDTQVGAFCLPRNIFYTLHQLEISSMGAVVHIDKKTCMPGVKQSELSQDRVDSGFKDVEV